MNLKPLLTKFMWIAVAGIVFSILCLAVILMDDDFRWQDEYVFSDPFTYEVVD